MAKDQKPAEELNAIAEQTKQQALAATDTYFNFLKKAVSSYPSGGMGLATTSRPMPSRTSPPFTNSSRS